jgi:BirA family biotin operon repressor/biotin-[acetyl-CoA-carboxylase] ligase
MHNGGSLPEELSEPLSRAWSSLSPLVRDVHWVAQTGSTMDLAQAMAGAARDGLLVVADEQTAGRGRRGRTWASPPGAGLYFSLLLRPPVPSVLGLLTLAAGVGVGDGVVAATGLRTHLKWPNDVLVERRKLAGILAEGLAVGTPDQAVVLGVGVNVSAGAYPPDVASRATSLESELGRTVDRGEVLTQILAAMARWYRALLEARYDEVLEAWRAAAPSATGTKVEWATPDGVRRGVTAGIDGSGALLVRTPAGIERLIAGEVTWMF